MPSPRSAPLAGLALLAVLAGCTGGTGTATGAGSAPSTGTTVAPTTDATGPSGPPPGVTLVRSGGFAPATRVVRLAPDGTWEFSGGRDPARHGRLTPAQRERLSVLAAALVDESPPATGHPCPDGRRYTVTVGGGAPVEGTDCDLPARPALAALVEFVTAVTPL
jgi:hypothetical protein